MRLSGERRWGRRHVVLRPLCRDLLRDAPGADVRPRDRQAAVQRKRADALAEALRLMTARRFTDKPDLNPWAVRGLPANHPAMVENRTLFPSTVVDVTPDMTERLLVSGRT